MSSAAGAGGGGFGAGNAGGYTGGGGLGAGGALFVAQGGQLSIAGSLAVAGDSVAGGAGGNPGQALGAGIFVQGTQTLTLAPSAGGSEIITDSLSDQGGLGGAMSLLEDGQGSVDLAGALSYAGSTSVQSGTLDISGDASALGGPISIAAGATLVESDLAKAPTGAITDNGALVLDETGGVAVHATARLVLPSDYVVVNGLQTKLQIGGDGGLAYLIPDLAGIGVTEPLSLTNGTLEGLYENIVVAASPALLLIPYQASVGPYSLADFTAITTAVPQLAPTDQLSINGVVVTVGSNGTVTDLMNAINAAGIAGVSAAIDATTGLLALNSTGSAMVLADVTGTPLETLGIAAGTYLPSYQLSSQVSGSGVVDFAGVPGTVFRLTSTPGWTGGSTIASGVTVALSSSATGLTGGITDNGVLSFSAGGVLSTSLSGGGAILQAGSSALTLATANSISGGVTIAAGALNVGTIGAAGSGAISFAPGAHGTLALAKAAFAGIGGGTFALANQIAGFGLGDTLDLQGLGGTATLSLASGTLNITNGGHIDQLTLATGFSLGAATLVSFADGTGGTDIAMVPLSQGFTITDSASERSILAEIGQGGSLAASNAIDSVSVLSGAAASGTADLVNLPAGTQLAITGSNARLPDGLTIAAGTVSLAGVTLGGAISLAAGASLTLGNGVSLPGTGLSLASGAAVTVAPLAAVTDSIAGGITGAGSLVMNGAGVLSLSGSNAFSGGVLLNAGTLALGSAAAAGTGAINLAGSTDQLQIAAGAAPTNTILAFAPGETITLAGVSATSVSLAPGNVLLIGTGSGASAGTLALHLDPAASYAADLIAVNQLGSTAVVTLTPRSASAASETALNADIIALDGNGLTWPSGVQSTISVTGSLPPAAVSGITPVRLPAGEVLLLQGNHGTINGGGTQSGLALQSGTVALSNLSLNGFAASGALVVGSGAVVSATGLNISGAGGISLQAGATLTIDATAGQTDSIAAGVSDPGGAYPGAGSGHLVLNGPGTVVLGAADALSGGITVQAGTLDLAAAGAAGSGGITLSAGAALLVQPGVSAGAVSGLATSSDSIDFASVAPGALVIGSAGGNATVNGATIVGVANVVVVSDGAGGSLVRAPITSFSVGSATSLATTLAGIDAGGSDAAPNTAYTIALTPGLGTLALGSVLPAISLASGSSLTMVGNFDTIDGGGSLAGLSLAAGALSIVNLALDDFAGSGLATGGGSVSLSNITFAGDTASGLAVGAGGKVTLATPSFATDGTDLSVAAGQSLIVTGGTLAASNSGTVATLGGGAVLSLAAQAGQTVTVGGAIAGAGGLLIGAGAVTLAASSSYSGGTSVGGLLDLAASGAAGSGAITLGGGSTLRIENGIAVGNTLFGFGPGQTIDAVGMAGASVSLAGTLLTVAGASRTLALSLGNTLDPNSISFSAQGNDEIIGDAARTLARPVVYEILNYGSTYGYPFFIGDAYVGGTYVETAQVSNYGNETLIGTIAGLGNGLSANVGTINLVPGTSTDVSFTLTPSAGVISNAATFDFSSVTPNQPVVPLASQVVGFAGTIFTQATPLLSSGSLDLGAARVGAAAPSGSVSVSNGTIASATQNSLYVTQPVSLLLSPPYNSGISESYSGGSFFGDEFLASGQSIPVSFSLLTGAAGSYAKSITLSFQDAPTIPVYEQTNLGSQSIQITGTVYAQATASLPTSIDVGVVHIGGADSANLVVTNSANAVLSDSLIGRLSGVSGGFVASGSVGTLAAGASGTVGLTLATGSAGVFTDSATLALTSHDPALPDLVLAPATIALTGTVDNYATAALHEISGGGVLTGAGTLFTLALGTIGSAQTITLGVQNTATGQADVLNGSFALTDPGGFSNSGFSAFSGLAAGAQDSGLSVVAGLYGGSNSETIVLTPTGSNASGYVGALAPITLTITSSVPTTDYTITDTADLTAAIAAISAGGVNAHANTAYEFAIVPASGSTISLGSVLAAITLDSGSSLSIVGNGDTIDGGGSITGLSLAAGALSIANLALDDMAGSGITTSAGAAAQLSKVTLSGDSGGGVVAGGPLSLTNTRFAGDGTSVSGADVSIAAGQTLIVSGGSLAASQSGAAVVLGAGAVLSLAPAAGQAVTVGGGISGGGSVLVGAGAVTLSSASSYAGGTGVDGLLDLAASGAAGSGAITLATGATLELGPGVTLGNTIDGFGGGLATIDLVGLAHASASVHGAALTLSAGGASTTLTLGGPTLSAYGLMLSSDGAGGTDVSYAAGAVPEVAALASLLGSVSLGNLHVGASEATTIAVSNTVLQGGDTLLGGFGVLPQNLVAGGSLDLGPGQTGDLTLTLTADGDGPISTAGSLGLYSLDGAVGGANAQPIGGGTVVVAATGYLLADPIVSKTLDFGTFRAAGSLQELSGTIAIGNGIATDPYQESLLASASTQGLDVFLGNASGVQDTQQSILAGGAGQLGLILFGDADTSGTLSDTVTLALTSTGVGTSGLADTALPSQTVTVTGTEYAPAAADLSTTSINFGLVHAGDVLASQTIDVGNFVVGAGTLVDQLDAGLLLGAYAPFSASVAVSKIANFNQGSVVVGLDTGSSGSFTTTAVLELSSHDAALADLALPNQTITLAGTVDNYATVGLMVNDTLVTGAGSVTTLDLGTIVAGQTLTIEAENTAFGVADTLAGSYAITASAGFSNSGFSDFSGVGALNVGGPGFAALGTDFGGVQSETIVVSGTGSNSSGYSGAVASRTLVLVGTVAVGSYVDAAPIADEATLNSMIAAFDVGGSLSAIDTDYTLSLAAGADIMLGSALEAVDLAAGSTLTVIGNGTTIDGMDSQRGFVDLQGGLVLDSLTIANAVAVGMAGGTGYGVAGPDGFGPTTIYPAFGGGGGAGLGGGLFVAGSYAVGGTTLTTGGSATLNGVVFANDAAVGGAGGAALAGSGPAAGSGGGLGASFGGLGSGGFGSGGSGLRLGYSVVGFYRWVANEGVGNGYAGGFGGGGGGGYSGGAAGYGAGAGGGGGFGYSSNYAGSYTNSAAGWAGGGGGLGAGGDVFVQQGGKLTFGAGSLGAGSALGGVGGLASGSRYRNVAGHAGQGLGGAAFFQAGETVTLAPLALQTLDIAGALVAQSGSGTLEINGQGVVAMQSGSAFNGAIRVDAGTLSLGDGIGGISGPIIDNAALLFSPAAPTSFAAPISGTGNVIIGGDVGTTVTLAGSLGWSGNTTIMAGNTLTLDGTGALSGDIVDDGVLLISGPSPTGAISGTGAVVFEGAVSLFAPIDFANGFTLAAGGNLSIAADGALGPDSAPMALLDGSTLSFANGLAFGHALSVSSDPTVSVATGETVTMSGSISDGANPGDLVLTGGGRLILSAANSYSGGSVIQAGTLELATPWSAGSGQIWFNFIPGNTLVIDGTTMPTNVIGGFVEGDALVLPSVNASIAGYDGSTLTLVVAGGGSLDLALYAGFGVGLSATGGPGGTTIAADSYVTFVTQESDLNAAIASFDVGGNQAAANVAYTIELPYATDIALTAQLQAVNLLPGSSLTILGNSSTIDGLGAQRGFVDVQGGLVLNTLTLANLVAIGGPGGTGQVVGTGYLAGPGSGGGGGAGLGGGLFVAGANAGVTTGGSATLNGVSFVNNAASGGAGGGLTTASVTFGPYGPTTSGPVIYGAGGMMTGATGGVFTSGFGTQGGFGGGGAGKGGAGGFGGGGGGGGGPNGGSGGYGAGAGGGYGVYAYNLSHGVTYARPWPSAYALNGGGGGGLGAGADVFVQQGGGLTIEGGTLGVGTVSGGLGTLGGANGTGLGSAAFIQGGAVTLAPGVGQTLEIGGSVASEYGAGTLLLDGAGTVLFDAGASFNGSIVVDAGTLDIAGDPGLFTGAISFGGGSPGVLVLANGSPPAGGISQPDIGDAISLPGIQAAIDGWDGSNLTLNLSSGGSLNLPLSGDTTAVNLVAVSSSAGTVITADAPCYVTGTRILTTRGEVAVEALAVGDEVITASGQTRPIRWIGHRRVECDRHPEKILVWPVLVTQDAFGPNLPARPLWLSPGHSVMVNGALIQIGVLVNDRTILQVPRKRVEYWHIELDSHDILLAEGLPAESFLDNGNRGAFDNGGRAMDLHPDFGASAHPAEGCLPVFYPGSAEVAEARRSLLARAAERGHLLEDEPDLHVVANGQRVEPTALGGGRYAFLLPADCSDISLRCRTFIPYRCAPDSLDRRALGILISRLELDGMAITLAELPEGKGWHGLEADDDGRPRRWTDGLTPLPAGTRLIMIERGGPGLYWSDSDAVSVQKQKGRDKGTARRASRARRI